MLKLRYDKTTGKIGSAYSENIIVPEPFILITEEENSAIVNRDNIYVINGELVDITDSDKEQELKAQKTARALSEQLYQLKASVAYGGVILNNQYVFETNATSILMTTSKYADIINNPELKNVQHWKCYTLDGVPIFLTFTREQFIQIKNFASNMIDTECFGVENKYTKKLQKATVKQLNSYSWLTKFKQDAIKEMNTINRNMDIGNIVLS